MFSVAIPSQLFPVARPESVCFDPKAVFGLQQRLPRKCCFGPNGFFWQFSNSSGHVLAKSSQNFQLNFRFFWSFNFQFQPTSPQFTVILWRFSNHLAPICSKILLFWCFPVDSKQIIMSSCNYGLDPHQDFICHPEGRKPLHSGKSIQTLCHPLRRRCWFL